MSDQTAKENWDRYRYALLRGHRAYTAQARKCERMYLGGGRQWDAEDIAILRAQRRPAYEFNEIMPSINSALGRQIANRLDISFRPRGGVADQELADVHAKVIMQVADRQHLKWKEGEVFADGLIQQRGYYDVRVEFDTNMQGNITITVPDPLDVIPDPDAKTYEPAGWSDVITTRWLLLDEIEQLYGKAKRITVENARSDDSDWGDGDDSGEARNKFGEPRNSGLTYDSTYLDGTVKRVRVIDRQRWVRTLSQCLFYPRTGDLKMAENMPAEILAQHQANGAMLTKAMQRRVKWTVSTMDHELHNEWSPYGRFTIIPYFAYFRRGQTIGMVDNAIGPQEAVNKALSQFVHIVNTSANSGWMVEENSLTNMTTEDLETKGAMTGLVVEFGKGATPPRKIEPNAVPTGVDRLIDRATQALKSVTVPEAMRGINGADASGTATQSKEWAAMQQIAMPVDNLARTRHLLAEQLLELEQQFYTEERVIRITENDPTTGKPVDASVTVNQHDPATGAYANDLTQGDYDVVITEQPMQATFENGQFDQALNLRKVGVAIPDTVMVQHSTLSRKTEIVEQMQGAQKPAADPLLDAKVALTQAQVRRTDAETVNKSVEGMFSATQAANQIATLPAIAPLADKLLHSAGFSDQDAGSIVPGVPTVQLGAQAPPTNTNPLTPANPGVGMHRGIESIDQPVPQP
jgi:hypothetical protein